MKECSDLFRKVTFLSLNGAEIQLNGTNDMTKYFQNNTCRMVLNILNFVTLRDIYIVRLKLIFYKKGTKISWLKEYWQILSRKIEALFMRDNICKKPCNHEILAPFLEKMNFRHHTRQAPFELH